jgi:hypothetical protein
MTFRNYTNTLIEMLKRNPEIEHYEVIYSQDDEGNSFQKVNFEPIVVLAENLENSYVKVASSINNISEGNAVCIN